MAQQKRSLSDRIKALQAKEAANTARANRAKEIKQHQDAIKRLRSSGKTK